MSTTIKQNNTDLQAVLDSVNALEPNSGGGAPDTCSVTINLGGSIHTAVYSSFDDTGKIITKTEFNIVSESYSLSNVLCGSIIYLECNFPIDTYGIQNPSMQIKVLFVSNNYVAMIAPTTANITGVITLPQAFDAG